MTFFFSSLSIIVAFVSASGLALEPSKATVMNMPNAKPVTVILDSGFHVTRYSFGCKADSCTMTRSGGGAPSLTKTVEREDVEYLVGETTKITVSKKSIACRRPFMVVEGATTIVEGACIESTAPPGKDLLRLLRGIDAAL